MSIIFREEIAQADDQAAERARLAHEYEDRFANPYIAASRGYVDDVIIPSDTRPRVIAALEMLDGKRQSEPAAQARQHPALVSLRKDSADARRRRARRSAAS